MAFDRGYVRGSVRLGRMNSPQDPIRIGVSACLLGYNVRHDGRNKACRNIQDYFGQIFELIPLCPEIGIGMGAPRLPIQLVEKSGQIRAIGVQREELDVTEALAGYAETMADQLTRLSGLILKSSSPSCGLKTTHLYDEQGTIIGQRSGLFAETLIAHYPRTPIIDEKQLHDHNVRDDFIAHIEAYHEEKVRTAPSSTGRPPLLHRQPGFTDNRYKLRHPIAAQAQHLQPSDTSPKATATYCPSTFFSSSLKRVARPRN